MSYTKLICYLDYHSYGFKNYNHVRDAVISKINEICTIENDLILPLQEFGEVIAKTELVTKEDLISETKLIKAVEDSRTFGIPNKKSFLELELLKLSINVRFLIS